MKRIVANIPNLEPPTWAILQRHLLEQMNAAAQVYLAHFCLPDGTLRWGASGEQHGRDDVDDFYEAFYNLPLLYLLGGDSSLLQAAHKHWEATTTQLTKMGLLEREFERGADHFHQGESLIYFYFLCLADPENPRLLERAERFANFYTGADPLAPNYDAQHKMIRAPHNGALGPRWGYSDLPPEQIVLEWHDGMEQFGLPFYDIPEAQTWQTMMSPTGAAAMGAAMQQRYGRGDVSTNLGVTSLVANAFLITQKLEYQDWVLEYTRAWRERAAQNGGILPDNVGLNGIVGEDFDGKWYGGLYGWLWPHGFYNVGMSATIAACNAYLLSRETSDLDLIRWQFDHLHQKRRLEPDGRWRVPYRHGDNGWFDWQHLPPTLPVTLWNIAQHSQDAARLEEIRTDEWLQVAAHRNKEDAGHEGNWLEYLAGHMPDYPETILRQTLGHVARRLEQIRHDDTNLLELGDKNVHLWVHIWQKHDPISTEALVQLTLGAPQFVYNGGLLHTRVRYFDALESRSGLPQDVAALVSSLEPTHTTLTLVNLSMLETREVIVQAGMFSEHLWGQVRFESCITPYPNSVWEWATELEYQENSIAIDDARVLVVLPPAMQITLHLETKPHQNSPRYRTAKE